MGKNVHVVVLAGGYSTDVKRGAPSAAAAAAVAAGLGSNGKHCGSGGTGGGALAAVMASPSAAVTPALLPLDGVPAVVRLLRALKCVKRVQLQAVWLVHNESESAALRGPGGLFGAAPETDLGLPAVNFVSNGATGPHDWRGEAADLRSALAAISSASGSGAACVAALSSGLAFMPNYNMQRLLEHSYLRGRDVAGCSHLNGVDLALVGEQGHLSVVSAGDTALPRIERIERLGSPGQGDRVAEPYLFLRPETVAAVARGGVPSQGPGVPAGLPELAQALVAAGTYVAAVDLMFGRYHLRTAQAVDYADRFFAFCAAAAIDPSAVGLKPEAVLQPYNATPDTGAGSALPPVPAAGSFKGRSTAADFRFDELDRPAGGTARSGASSSSQPPDSLYGTDYEAFLQCASAFNERFFGEAATGRKGTVAAPGMKRYLLPPTFYMTAYRRQGADIMF